METVVRVRRTSNSVDAYGQPIWAETSTNIQAIVSARTGSKTVGAAEITVTSGLTCYLPANTDVQNDDVFIVRGVRYVLDGESFDWRSAFGSWSPGTVIDLQRELNG